MRQVPNIPNYLLIGGGKLARHMARYFDLLNIPYSLWNRSESSTGELVRFLKHHSHVLLCIKDDAIVPFFEQFGDSGNVFIHFSGSLVTSQVKGFHPLMSFGQQDYKLEIYQNIHFVGIEPSEEFKNCFPTFRNTYSKLDASQMNRYHSLCVLSGNGTTLLWDLIGKEFESMGLPQKALIPYLHQITQNIMQNQPGRWSGPWYRKDLNTISKNKEALKEGPLSALYYELEKLSSESGHINEKHS